MKAIFKQLICLAAAALFCGCSSTAVIDEAAEYSESTATLSVRPSQLLSCNYYIEQDFEIYTAMTESYDCRGEIVCGIVPHHLTPGRMTAAFMQTAAESRSKTDAIVYIGTMHYFDGNALVTTTLGWNSPYGIVENDTTITSELIDKTGAVCDNELMEYDHAISGLIPFSSLYFPNVPVSCLLVSGRADKTTADMLCSVLEEISEHKNCLFIFSIDFSHYLEPWDTEEHDEDTLKAIIEKDYTVISQMTDSNVDSPYCLNTFLKLSNALGLETIMLDHSNTYEITALPYNKINYIDGITSYFIFAACK